jgi:hypothetical protein
MTATPIMCDHQSVGPPATPGEWYVALPEYCPTRQYARTAAAPDRAETEQGRFSMSVRRRITAGVAVVIIEPPAMSRPATPASASVIDIGYTVFQNGKVKGSGSYTRDKNAAWNEVCLMISKRYDGERWFTPDRSSMVCDRADIRGGGERVSFTFSPKDLPCDRNRSFHAKTLIGAYVSNGTTRIVIDSKESNTIFVDKATC